MPSVGKKESKILHAIARKRIKDLEKNTTIQDMQQKIQAIAEIPNGRPALYQTPQEMETVIAEYFQEVETKKQHPTITGLALKLGIDRRTLLEYKNRDKFNPIINRAKQTILAYTENMLVDKLTFTPGQIFYLKNNYKNDYSDKVEVEHTGSISLVDLNRKAMQLQDCEIIDAEEDSPEAISPQEEAQA